MQTETSENAARPTGDVWIERCRAVEKYVVLAFAIALSLPITIPWIVVVVGIIVWFAKNRSTPLQVVKDFTGAPLALPILVFALVDLASALINGGIHDLGSAWSTLRSFLLYFWSFAVFRDQPQLKRIEVMFLLSVAAIAGLVGTIEQRLDIHLGDFKFLQGTGFLSGPMAFAGQMQLFSLLAIGFFFNGGAKYFAAGNGGLANWRNGLLSATTARAWFCVVLVCNVLGLVFAFERSAWLGFAVAVAALAGLVSWRLLLKVSLLGLFAAGIMWVTVPAVQARIAPMLHWQEDPSMRGRAKVWGVAMDLSRKDLKSEIIGIGPTKFPHIKLDEATVGPGLKVKDYLDHAHSNYLQALCTTGIVGLVSYLWLTFASLRLAWIRFKRDAHGGGAGMVSQSSAGIIDGADFGSDPKPSAGIISGVTGTMSFEQTLALGIMGGLISLMVAGIFEYNFGTGQVRLTQWFLLGLLATSPRATRASEKSAG